MNTPQIILIAFLIAVAAAICILVGIFKYADKQAGKYDTVGKTLYWARSKIPFLGRTVIEYTRKGRPYQTATGITFKPKHFKEGAIKQWTIYTYHLSNKPPMTKAKRRKKAKEGRK